MRILLTTAGAVILTAAVAAAQYKPAPTQTVAPPAVPQAPGTVQSAPNPNIQIQPATAIDDELATANRVDRDKAVKMVKDKKAVWVDVRSQDAYDQGHIPGAINIPLSELIGRLKELPPRKYLITYCA